VKLTGESMMQGKHKDAPVHVPRGRPAIPERRAPPDADALLRELLVEVAAVGLTHIEAWQGLRHHGISRSVLQRAWARAIVSGELRCVEPGVSSFGGRWAMEIRSKNADGEPES
jgi:hypothetical protein